MATRVERSGIEDCISKINTAIEELSNAAAEINATMDALPEYWEGAAYDKARDVYENDYKTLLVTTLPDAVTNFKDYINGCKEKILEIDEQLANA